MASKNPRHPKGIEKFGSNVRKQRILKGLTMLELAFEADIEYGSLSRIELGKSNPTVSTIYVLAEALGVHPSVLLED